MKRKLISFDGFQRIEKDSFSTKESELVEAQDVLARVMDVGDLEMHCFGESTVVYRTPEDTYIHAGYRLNESHIFFEGIQELVIDEETERNHSRKVLTDIVESLLDDNEAKATDLFGEFMKLPAVRRSFKHPEPLEEGFKVTVSKPTGKRSPLWHKKQSRSDVAKRIRSMVKTKRRLKSSSGLASQLGRQKARMSQKLGGSNNPRWRVYARKVKASKMNEWSVLSENVLDYVEFQELGPALKDSRVQYDDKGNIKAIAVPRSQTRNEGKILSFNWKTLDHEIKYSRSGAKNLQKENAFCRAVAELKRHNAVSDNTALETALENIVGTWPQVLFLTQDELATAIGEALETAGVRSYDDRICQFMAEGILRVAHTTYPERAKKIVNISQLEPTTESQDAYVAFKDVVDRFYPTLDESVESQYKVFADLYKALHEIYRVVDKEGDEAAKSEVASYMQDCESILNRQSEPSLELAEAIAVWLHNITEGNVEGASDSWDVSNDTHTTLVGDHPQMAKNAKVAAIPGTHTGDWGSKLPVSDGKSYKGGLDSEMQNSWANVGGNETAPELTNPYIPKPFGDYTMKGEKGVDKASDDFGTWQGKDTWPNLQNPVVPDEAGGTGGTGFKMKSDNLVVDK